MHNRGQTWSTSSSCYWLLSSLTAGWCWGMAEHYSFTLPVQIINRAPEISPLLGARETISLLKSHSTKATMPCLIERVSSVRGLEEGVKDRRESVDAIASSKALGRAAGERSPTVMHYHNTKTPFNTRGQGNWSATLSPRSHCYCLPCIKWQRK